jgi:hypothetical protein
VDMWKLGHHAITCFMTSWGHVLTEFHVLPDGITGSYLQQNTLLAIANACSKLTSLSIVTVCLVVCLRAELPMCLLRPVLSLTVPTASRL